MKTGRDNGQNEKLQAKSKKEKGYKISTNLASFYNHFEDHKT